MGLSGVLRCPLLIESLTVMSEKSGLSYFGEAGGTCMCLSAAHAGPRANTAVWLRVGGLVADVRHPPLHLWHAPASFTGHPPADPCLPCTSLRPLAPRASSSWERNGVQPGTQAVPGQRQWCSATTCHSRRHTGTQLHCGPQRFCTRALPRRATPPPPPPGPKRAVPCPPRMVRTGPQAGHTAPRDRGMRGHIRRNTRPTQSPTTDHSAAPPRHEAVPRQRDHKPPSQHLQTEGYATLPQPPSQCEAHHRSGAAGTRSPMPRRWSTTTTKPSPRPRCGIRELNATLLKQAGECNTTKSEQKALQ